MFDFPPTSVVQSTALVAGSGIQNSKNQQQAGFASSETRQLAIEGFDSDIDVGHFGGIDSDEPVRAFQGAGNYGDIIVAKLAGSESQSVPLVYSNVVQNSSFESGSAWWNLVLESGTATAHGVNIVTEFPPGRGFDNGDPDDLEVPHGRRMLHMWKEGEEGTIGLYQTIDELSHTSLLGAFQFSAAPDSAFASIADPAARQGMVALQFINTGVTFYTLAYNFTGGQLPKRPSGFPSIDRLIALSHNGADQFETFTRVLTTDVASTFSYTQIRLWIITDMEDTEIPAAFDTLWDWFIITTGQAQDELFPTQVDQKLIVESSASSVGSRNFFSVLGTQETYERDFDRSPFFFTPSEIDPNTVRDRTEIEPFLLFSHAFLRTFENFNAIPRTVPLIGIKGPVIEDETFAPVDVVINGGFETGGFSGWVVSSGVNTGVVQSSSEIPGPNIPNGISPQEGDYFAYCFAPIRGMLLSIAEGLSKSHPEIRRGLVPQGV